MKMIPWCLMVFSLWFAGGSSTEEQLFGTWDVTFFEGGNVLTTEQFEFQNLLIFFFLAPSDPPADCLWIGLNLGFGETGFISGAMSCSQLGPYSNFSGVLFGPYGETLDGLIFSFSLNSLVGSYHGVMP